MVDNEGALPPIAAIAVASMAVVVVGGTYLAAYLPKVAPLGPAIAFLVVATILLTTSIVMLSRIKNFAWDNFFLVGRWTLLAYVVIAGMLEYIFLVDSVRGSLLAILTAMLVIYAVDIPLLLAFSVARYQPAKTSVPSA